MALCLCLTVSITHTHTHSLSPPTLSFSLTISLSLTNALSHFLTHHLSLTLSYAHHFSPSPLLFACVCACLHRQAIRRGLGLLPMSSQIFRESPYFDLNLFSFDDKNISPADRLKHCPEFPVKFYSRLHNGSVAFKIHAGEEHQSREKSIAEGHTCRSVIVPILTLCTFFCVRVGRGGVRPQKRLASYIFHPFLPFVISVQVRHRCMCMPLPILCTQSSPLPPITNSTMYMQTTAQRRR